MMRSGRYVFPAAALWLLLAAPAGAMTPQEAGKMVVHKDPNCGCCTAWAEAMEAEGFKVRISERADLDAVKKEAGVPEGFEGCHTATVAGYTLEGHVPLEAIRQLLEDEPKDVRGLAVPGMPVGSLGMGTDPEAAYDVLALKKDGEHSLYMKIRDNEVVDE